MDTRLKRRFVAVLSHIAVSVVSALLEGEDTMHAISTTLAFAIIVDNTAKMDDSRSLSEIKAYDDRPFAGY